MYHDIQSKMIDVRGQILRLEETAVDGRTLEVLERGGDQDCTHARAHTHTHIYSHTHTHNMPTYSTPHHTTHAALHCTAMLSVGARGCAWMCVGSTASWCLSGGCLAQAGGRAEAGHGQITGGPTIQRACPQLLVREHASSTRLV